MRRFARRLLRWFAIVELSQQQLHGMVFATDRKDGNSRIERPPTSFGFCMGERLFFRVRPKPVIGPIFESACCGRISRCSCLTLAHHSKRAFRLCTSTFRIGCVGPIPEIPPALECRLVGTSMRNTG